MLCKHKQHYKLCETIVNILRYGYKVVYGTGNDIYEGFVEACVVFQEIQP